MDLRKAIGRLVGDREGAALVETALVLPMLLITMAGLIDGGRAILQRMQLQGAAQAAAEQVRQDAGDLAGAQTAALQAAGLTVTLTPSPQIVYACATAAGVQTVAQNTRCPNGSPAGQFVLVTAQAPFTPIMPWPGSTFASNLQATATVRLS